ncbi:MAG TPA: hypothetical protein VFD92_26915 [Candidatus Binatia bacterium]|nr:hypothetical protein [Candidatus Binatia bacterium]
MRFTPMTLTRVPEPFDDPGFVFELKYDGFRALAFLEEKAVRLVSRHGNVYRQFADLCRDLAAELRCSKGAVLDGEIVCLDDDGTPVFEDLFRRRGQPVFVAFDLLELDGRDLRDLPLIDRKRRLRRVVPRDSTSALYLDHVEGAGIALYQWACERDLEGIVGKPKRAPYREASAGWVKIKSPTYSQAVGRFDQLRRRR